MYSFVRLILMSQRLYFIFYLNVLMCNRISKLRKLCILAKQRNSILRFLFIWKFFIYFLIKTYHISNHIKSSCSNNTRKLINICVQLLPFKIKLVWILLHQNYLFSKITVNSFSRWVYFVQQKSRQFISFVSEWLFMETII